MTAPLLVSARSFFRRRRGWRAFRHDAPLELAAVHDDDGPRGSVLFVRGDGGDFLDDVVEAADDAPEDDVFAVEMGARAEGDEELGAVPGRDVTSDSRSAERDTRTCWGRGWP